MLAEFRRRRFDRTRRAGEFDRDAGPLVPVELGGHAAVRGVRMAHHFAGVEHRAGGNARGQQTLAEVFAVDVGH